jgi:Gas vesicle synthesis protein GvpL/GvpF
MAMIEPDGLWVYAVTRPGAEVDSLTGVAGGPVRLVAAGELTAVVSPVDLAEFGPEPLRRNLEKLPWLEAVARAHHQVIAAISATSAVVPMRLATVYRTPASLARMLVQRAGDFQAVLARTANCAEWGVKAYLIAADAPQPGGEQVAAARSQPGSGTDYLRRRRAQLTADEDLRREAAASAERLHCELCAVASASARHRPQDPQLSGRRTQMILNGTYLVEDRRRERFAATVSRSMESSSSVRVEVTGPWPPYSFATTEPDSGPG